jgi:hypothetical protein
MIGGSEIKRKELTQRKTGEPQSYTEVWFC